MTAVQTPSRRPLRFLPLLAGAGLLAAVVGMQVGGLVPGTRPSGAADAYLADPLLAPPPAEQADGSTADGSTSDTTNVTDAGPARGGAATDGGFDAAAELARVRADVDFWAAKLEADPANIVAAVELSQSDVALARMTGDVASYVAAETAVAAALEAQPDYLPAKAARATILVSLHQFPAARDLALEVLSISPDDPTALGALGDSRLELGDLAAAATAYHALAQVADGSASRIRAARLAFVTGDPNGAVAGARSAVAAATDEGLEGDALAFDDSTLGDLLLSVGDAGGARAAYTAGLAARPDHPASLVGLARLDAFAGRLDDAIQRLDTAIATIPQPDWLARRADLLDRRDGPGDVATAADDRATIEAIARLAGAAGNVYDRVRALYLSDHGLQPDLAVKLATDELAIRPDIYGYDALAWALLNAGRPADALVPARQALAAGTRDAKLWYHAGVVEAANRETVAAREHLSGALALGPALDPVSRDRAATILAALP
jgi:tetratricopeptide (TPR) repeat protein